MKICIFLFIILNLLLGCAVIPMTTIAPTVEEYITPSIGSENTVYIGEPLLKEGKTSAQNAIHLLVPHGKRKWTAYHPKGIYKLQGKTDGFTVYQGSTLEHNGWSQVYPQILEDIDENCYLKTNSDKKLLAKTDYKKKKYVEDSSDEYQQILIYTGRDDSVLKFTYREFMSDLARPAFTIDSTYDIEDDKIIRFKGASLEVIKVDNQSITYKLLSGFKSSN